MKHRIFIVSIISILLVFSLIGSCIKKDNIYDLYEKTSVTELSQRGDNALKANNPDSALIYYTLVTNKLREETPDSLKKLIASAYVSQGYIYLFYKNDYLSSYSSYLKALDQLDNISDSTLYPEIYLNIGNIFLDYKEDAKMWENYKKSFSHSVKEKDWKTLKKVLTTLNSLAISENNTSVISDELMVFDTMKIPDSEEFRALKLQREAVASFGEKDYENAINLLRKAKGISDMGLIQNRYGVICDIQIADILKHQKKYDESIRVVKEMNVANNNELDIKKWSYTMLSELYANKNEADSALKYLQLNNALADTLFKSQQYGLIRDIGLNHDLTKLDSKIKTVEMKRAATTRAFFIVCIALAIIIALAVIVFYQNRKLKQRNFDLFQRSNLSIERENKERELRQLFEKQIEELSGKVKSLEAEKDKTEIDRIENNEEKTDEAEQETSTKIKKYKNSHLTEAMRTGLLARIELVLNNEKEIVTNDFSLDRLATLVSSNTSYVSQIINDVYGKNFQTLLGEIRIKMACERLCDENYNNLSIEGIALDLGFKSRTNFISVFKRITGLTPSEYRKINKETSSGL